MTKVKKAEAEKTVDEAEREEAPDGQAGPETDEKAVGDGQGERDGEKSPEGAEDGQQEADGADGESADVKYLRLAADFQNYKKRTERERFERYTEGKKDFAAAMLPILDNFDRALAQDAAIAEGERERLFVEGMDMILKQFVDVLAANGVNEIEALGEDFDPNVHHAVIMEKSDTYESQKVSEVMQKGYKIGDKVIRPAMVKVAE